MSNPNLYQTVSFHQLETKYQVPNDSFRYAPPSHTAIPMEGPRSRSVNSQTTRSTKFRKLNPNSLSITRRRPVDTSVNRIYIRRRTTDLNNNQARILIHPASPFPVDALKMSQFELPPVSSMFGVTQVLLYWFAGNLGIKTEADVYVSWDKVIVHGEVWRLFVAQFFHFGKVHIFFNVVTLMALGRYLEKKIQPAAYAVLIVIMSVISNILYIFMNDILCSGPNNDFTVGFSTAMFSLRMIHIFSMDSDANNGKGDPNLIFGFLPVHLPPFIAPWQPLLETIFFDVVIIGRCVANNVSGMCAGLIFPYLMKNYRDFIMYPRNPPPPPPRTEPRNDENENNNDDKNHND